MKLLRVKASHFKNCQDDTVIDLVAKSKKTTEDKEYELQEITEGLYVYSIGAFVGKMLPVKQLLWNCWTAAMIFWVNLAWRISTIPMRESSWKSSFS